MRRLLLLALLAPLAASAQAPLQLEVQVTAIAGADVYLDAGTDARLAPGDTLRVLRGNGSRGHLVVRSASASRAVVGFRDDPFPITRGERLTIVWTPRADDGEEAAPVEPRPDEGRVSVFDRPPAGPSRPSSPQPRVTGRVQIGTSGFWAETSSPAGGGTSRVSATPFASVSARATDLPGGLRLRLDGRFTHRYRNGTPFDRPNDLRLYRASAAGDLGPVEIEGGRFFDPYDRFSGYLDGLRLHLGDASRGIGLAAGLQPDWGAGGFSTDLPRISASGHSRFTLDGAEGTATLLAGHVSPQLEGLQSRTYLGAEARLAGSAFTFSADALLDRDPATESYDFSRLNLRGSWSAAPGLRLDGRYSRSRPYILLGTLQTMRPATQRLGAGGSYTFEGSPLAAPTLRADVAVASRDGFSSVTYSGGLRAPRLPLAELGLDAYASVWTGRGNAVVTASGLLSRNFGRTWLSGGYRFSRSPQPAGALVTHGLQGTLQIPLMDRLALTLQGGADFSGRTTSSHIYTALWWRL